MWNASFLSRIPRRRLASITALHRRLYHGREHFVNNHALFGLLACCGASLWLIEHGKQSTSSSKDLNSARQFDDKLDDVSHSTIHLFDLMPDFHIAKALYEEDILPQHRLSVLRKRQTIRLIQDSASKETVNALYDVHWRKPLGQGSFGAVYKGRDRASGDMVAVKKIPKKFTDNLTFQSEIEALMYLREAGGHPNICGLRRNFDEGKYYYLVLDLITGGEMFDHLVAQGAYSEADAARLVREVASALAFCHGIGVVHGDLKPENLMLSSEHASDAVIKLVDFGCAQIIADEEGKRKPISPRATANTPAYSPPEVLERCNRKYRIDPSFDMWALGVIMYVMLTGVHPFDLYGNASDDTIKSLIVAGQKPPLHDSPITAHLTQDAIEVIESLLQWDPKKRLTADQLLQNAWVRGETARTSKIADSHKRLAAYRAFKTKLGAKVFAGMVSWSDNGEGSAIAKRTGLIEHAFHMMDPHHRGYVTKKELAELTDQNVDSSSEGDTEQLSLSGFSDLLAENMKNRYWPKGHIVYHENDIGNAMYFINSGAVEVFTKDGFSKTLRQPGDFFGEGALMHPKKIRSASVRCITPVHAIEISREYFEKYLASDMSVKLNLREKDKSRKRQRAKTILSLQQNMQEKTYSKGDYLFKVGEKGDALYIIEEGTVDISTKGHTVLSLGPGNMCGEYSLTMGRPRNVDVICVSDTCKAHMLRARDYYALLDSHPSLKDSIKEICLRREFQKSVVFKTQKQFPEKEEDLREVFDLMDTNKSGALELPNIRDIIQQFDPTATDQETRDILSILDLDETGKVSWEEFKRMFGMGPDPTA